MKRIILIMVLLPILLIGQTKNIVPRADSQGRLGTAAKAWLAVHADSIYILGSPLQDVIDTQAVTIAIPRNIIGLDDVPDASIISNYVVVSDEDNTGAYKASVYSLPASSQTHSLLGSKVNLNTPNGSQSSYTARQEYIDSVFTDIYARLGADPPDTSTTPYTPLNFDVDIIAATSSTGSFRLSWTPNGGDSVRIYRNGVYLTRVPISQTSYVTNGYTAHTETYTFRIQASTDEGLVSNYTESVNNQISKFMTKNFYVAPTAQGSGTGTSFANAYSWTSTAWQNAALEGDTVFFDGGSSIKYYNGRLALNDIDGTSANRVVLTKGTEAGHNGKVRITNTSIVNHTIEITNSSYLELSYFDMDSCQSQPWYMIKITSTGNSNIDIMHNDIYFTNGDGIANYANNTRILYNKFYSATDNLVTDDAIWSTSEFPIYNLEIGYNEIHQRNTNTVSTNHYDGMQLNHIAGTTLIHNNLIVRYGNADVYLSTGLYCDNGAEGDLYIWNNIFVCIGGTAKFNPLSIRNEEATNPLHVYVYNNTFYGGSMDLGANSSGLSTLTWKNNLFWKIPGYNNPGFNMGDGASYEFGSHDMDYNRYYISTTYPVLGDISYTWAAWLTHIGGGETNSATVTTGFTVIDNTSYDPLDWRLEEGSEGIDDGVDLSDVYPFTVYGTQDYFGVPRTGTWDIGACEGNSTYIAPVTDLAANGGSGEVVFTWTDIAGAAGYVVYGGTSTNPTDSVGFVTQGTQTWTKTGLGTGVIYYARLKTRDASYNYSAYSTQASDYTDGGGSEYLDQFADADYTADPAWTVVSGTFAVNNSAPISYDDNDYSLNSTATGFIYTPSSQAYGTWIFDVYYTSLGTGDRWYNLINAGTTITSDGYALIINWQGYISFRRYSGGSFTIPFTNTSGTLLSNATWYRIKVVRNQTTDQYVTGAAGTFGIYLSTDGSTYNLISATTGANPFTNNDITTSTNFSVYAEGANSRISNIMVY